jgi:hypothetical protein
MNEVNRLIGLLRRLQRHRQSARALAMPATVPGLPLGPSVCLGCQYHNVRSRFTCPVQYGPTAYRPMTTALIKSQDHELSPTTGGLLHRQP